MDYKIVTRELDKSRSENKVLLKFNCKNVEPDGDLIALLTCEGERLGYVLVFDNRDKFINLSYNLGNITEHQLLFYRHIRNAEKFEDHFDPGPLAIATFHM